MSYIHEALKKAQKEKDSRKIKYAGLFSSEGKENTPFLREKLWWPLAVGFIIFLAFAGSSWFDSNAPPEGISNHEPKRPVQKVDLYRSARNLHKLGRLEDAGRLYKEILKKDPGRVKALNNLGVIYIHQKNFLEARTSLEKAVVLNPDYGDPYYNLACLYALQHKPDKGLAYLKKALALDRSIMECAPGDRDLKNLWELPEFKRIIRAGR